MLALNVALWKSLSRDGVRVAFNSESNRRVYFKRLVTSQHGGTVRDVLILFCDIGQFLSGNGDR